MTSGIKISIPGFDVKTASPDQLSVSSDHAVPKCDLRPSPKHYGLIFFSITNLAGGTGKTLYQIPHGYSYIPAYLTQWNIPIGTDSLSVTDNATYGIGDADLSLNNGLYISMKTDNQYFTVSAYNGSGLAASATGSIRFYIFADDFSSS